MAKTKHHTAHTSHDQHKVVVHQHAKVRLTRVQKRFIGSIVTLAVLIGAGIVAGALIQTASVDDKPNITATQEAEQAQVIERQAELLANEKEANGLVADKGVNAGYEYFDQKISQAKQQGKPSVHVEYLLEKAVLALNNGQPQVAVSAATDAYGVRKDESTTSMLAVAYDRSGNKSQAITYYKEALEFAKKMNTEAPNSQKAYYERRIAELAE